MQVYPIRVSPHEGSGLASWEGVLASPYACGAGRFEAALPLLCGARVERAVAARGARRGGAGAGGGRRGGGGVWGGVARAPGVLKGAAAPALSRAARAAGPHLTHLL